MIDHKLIFLLLPVFLAPLPSHVSGSPFEIDVKELERAGSATGTTGTKSEKESGGQRSRQRSARTGYKESLYSGSNGYLHYTVQPGDHIFKILTGRIGMSNDEAERLIPGIIRTNRIRDIKNLAVGDTLLIPNREQRRRAAAKEQTVKATAAISSSRTEARGAPASKEPPTAAPVPVRPPVARATPPAAPPAAPATPPAATATPPAAPATPPAAAVVAPAAAVVPPAVAAAASLSSTQSGAAPATTWICPVPERDPSAVIDSLLALLQADTGGKKVLDAGPGSDGSTSIEVDRYFEYNGGRYIVSIGESDARRYTLLRVLETAGYKVLTLDGKEAFRDTADKLLRLVGVAPDFGRHPLHGGKGIDGFLIREEGTMGRRVVMSAERLEGGGRWVLAPECGAR